MTNAGMWIRVSTGGQDEANQVPDIEHYCTARGYQITRRYELHARSASAGEQDARLADALADLAAGRIKVLVCWHSDRLERRGVEALFRLLREVREVGGIVESTQEPALGAVDVGGEAMTALSAIMSHAESVKKSERVRIAHDRSRAAGAIISGAPFGYESSGEKYGKTLVPTDTGRRYVPEIFARVIDGQSLATVAAWLETEGVRPDSGTHWWPKTIGNLIRNPVYMGRRCAWDQQTRTYGDVTHRCESLADSVTWRRAGEALDTRPSRGPLIKANGALLAGILHCPRCPDSPMYRTTAGTTKKSYYYRCSGRGAARKGCGNLVPVDVTDGLVSRFMSELDEPIVRTVIIPGHDHQAELEDVRPEMRDLVSRDLPDAEFDAELSRLRGERDRLAALPSVPERVEYVPTGQSYADMWATLDGPERGAWLRANGIKVYAAKAVPGIEKPAGSSSAAAWALSVDGGPVGAMFGTLKAGMLAAHVLTGDGVSVLVSYLGSTIGDWDADAAE